MHLDEQRITQALLQLADNAVKHTDPGVRIGIGSQRRANTVRLWVEDAGSGVRAEDRARIFERFGRGAVRSGDEGFGLGLSIVRAIVDAHGGHIHVQRRRAARSALRDRPARQRGVRRAMARILIVEDEERIASFVAKGLRAEGHQTAVVGDGESGLDEALSGQFDLLVLDIGLPGMDGFAVLDALRSQGSRLPVIVLTARDSVTDTVSALEGGADDYMPKPFRFAELLARVRLRLRQAELAAGVNGVRDDILEAGGVFLDLRTRQATVDGRQVDLSAREFTLAEIFMLNAGQVPQPRAAARPRLGLRLRPGLQRRRRLRRLPAPQVRRRRRSARCAAWATASTADLEAQPCPRLALQHGLQRVGDLARQRPVLGPALEAGADHLRDLAGRPVGQRAAGPRSPAGAAGRVVVPSGSPSAYGRSPATAWKIVAPSPQTSLGGPGTPTEPGSACSGAR